MIDLERAARQLPAYLSSDVVLHKCYRNPREILICAHALGFGIYSDTIVQMLENSEHWDDVGYKVTEGEFVPGSKVVINRPAENSPLPISDVQEPNELIQYYAANDLTGEVNWVCEQIIDKAYPCRSGGTKC